MLVLAWATATACAQPVNPTPIEKILTVDALNGSKQSGVMSYLTQATEPKILVAIIPGNPVLARASVNFFTGKVLIQ